MPRIHVPAFGSAVLVIALVTVAGAGEPQRGTRHQPRQEQTLVGEGMGPLIPDLVQIGSGTQFFLALADRIALTEDQRQSLSVLAYDFQVYVGRKRADLRVAEAEYQRLLSQDRIDLAQVKNKLSEIKALEAEVEFTGASAMLRAIALLTHEQHLGVLRIAAAERILNAPEAQR